MERTILEFDDGAAFEAWLEVHHATAPGVWLRIAKKGAVPPSVTYAQALDAALCFGWIDGQKARHDDQSWLQYFTKRKPTSVWSQINRTHIARLEAAGRLRPAGAAAVKSAQENGQWERAYSASSRQIPPELEQALAERPQAKTFFDALDSQNRFAFIFRVSTPKTPETRQRKAREFVAMMEAGQVFYPKTSRKAAPDDSRAGESDAGPART